MSENDAISPPMLMEEGTEFDSFNSFQAALQQYSDANFVQFARVDSRSLEHSPASRIFNPAIQYSQLTYTCIYGGRKVRSRSNGIRNVSSRKCGCPVRLRLSASTDGERLSIKESKLNCHNHEINADRYRVRNLDEETEMEIYNLISMHDNKRLARMLIRDKLAKETGKGIKMKDISNIEKRVSRKLERLADDGKESSNSQAVGDEDIEKDESDSTDGIEITGVGSRAVASASVSSSSRPKRKTREPSRFKDFFESCNKVLATTANNIVSLMPVDDTGASGDHRHAPLAKVKVEPGTISSTQTATVSPVIITRGKKRKTQEEPTLVEHLETARIMEIKERKLAIQEELLTVEKEKIKLLQGIMKKLNTVIENQEKS